MKKPTSTIIKDQADQLEIERVSNKSPLFDRKIETATEGLIPYFSRTLSYKLPSENALTIANYIISMQTEINPSLNYRKGTINFLRRLSEYCQYRPFKSLERKDIVEFLDSYRKSEAADPLHNGKVW